MNQVIEKIHKNINSIGKLAPIVALASIGYFCLSSYCGKIGLALWGVPVGFGFNAIISLYIANKFKKELNSKEEFEGKSMEDLQKIASSTTVILASSVVALLFITFFTTYLILSNATFAVD